MVTPELLGLIRHAFPGAQISIAYGSTEAGSVCTLGPDDIDRKPGSVGLPVPGVRIEEGANGEMLVSSPTARAISPGWMTKGIVRSSAERAI
jgi:acyl-CoA synthetase (AMP-forming)/AMP-acid ligase II